MEETPGISSGGAVSLMETNKSLYPSDDEDNVEEILSHKAVMEQFQDGLTEIIVVCTFL